MNFGGLLILFSALSFFSGAQTSTYKTVDNYVHLISEKHKGSALKEKQLDGKRTPGGTITGYYMKNKLGSVSKS